jgi:hypothetical protein
MMNRVRSFFAANNKATVIKFFLNELHCHSYGVCSKIKSSLHLRDKKYQGKLNLGNQKFVLFGQHRSGWNFAIKSIRNLHNPHGILFDAYIERTFAWNPAGIKPHEEPWVGFIHVPPEVPSWFPGKQSNQEIFKSKAWNISLPYCKGLFTLSAYHKKNLEKLFDFPINNLFHPTEFPAVTWSWEKFRQNNDKKIVQVGWWLRKLASIYLLRISGYQKIFLRKDEAGIDDLLKREIENSFSTDAFNPKLLQSVNVLNFLSNQKYDQLLAENIIFLDLYDASANNAIIECIARNTPILVNPIEPVIEYLGPEYPFYFNSLEEAGKKAGDMDLIKLTHEYLVDFDGKRKLHAEYFRESLINSHIYKSL